MTSPLPPLSNGLVVGYIVELLKWYRLIDLRLNANFDVGCWMKRLKDSSWGTINVYIRRVSKTPTRPRYLFLWLLVCMRGRQLQGPGGVNSRRWWHSYNSEGLNRCTRCRTTQRRQQMLVNWGSTERLDTSALATVLVWYTGLQVWMNNMRIANHQIKWILNINSSNILDYLFTRACILVSVECRICALKILFNLIFNIFSIFNMLLDKNNGFCMYNKKYAMKWDVIDILSG